MTRSSRHASQQPRRRRDAASNAGKGAVIGPSRMPRREEKTDPAIGKGEEPLRPRQPQERQHDAD